MREVYPFHYGCQEFMVVLRGSDNMDSSSALPAQSTATETVWRYMSFARFVWLLPKRQLWLARADLLGAPWEIALVGDQLKFVISSHPPRDIFSNEPHESADQRSARIIKLWRHTTFVNCWSTSEHESHALWRIYCKSTEGVTLQTTLPKLIDSVGSFPVHRERYGELGRAKRTPTIDYLVSQKRPMFAYEREVRIVCSKIDDDSMPNENIVGLPLAWEAERYLDCIRVHPEADSSFFETVVAVVEHYAPALKNCVEWSAMKKEPPF
jgi:hypothetical protein